MVPFLVSRSQNHSFALSKIPKPVTYPYIFGGLKNVDYKNDEDTSVIEKEFFGVHTF